MPQLNNSTSTHERLLTDEMPLEDMVVALCQGNPGALNILIGLIQDNPINVLYFKLLDAFGIYGTELYVLVSDKCDRKMTMFLKVLHAVSFDRIPVERLQAIASDQYRQVNFTEDEITLIHDMQLP